MTRSRYHQLIAFLGMFTFALIANTLPALMTAFQRELGISISTSSLIPSINIVGVAVGSLTGAFLLPRYGIRTLLRAASLIGMGAVFFISRASGIQSLLLPILFQGTAIGLCFLSVTTLFNGLPRKMRHYTLLHGFFGLGGLIAPLIVKLFLGRGLPYQAIYLAYIGVILAYLFFILRLEEGLSKSSASLNANDVSLVVSNRFILFLCLALFLYAGSEVGIITWSGNFFAAVHGFDEESFAPVLSLFWLLFTGGRMAGHVIVNRFGEMETVAVTGLSAVGGIIVLLGGGPALSKLGLWLIGLSLAVIFPTIQGYINRHVEEKMIPLLNGFIFAGTGLMGTAVLSIMGSVAELSMYAAFVLPVLAFLFIIGVACGCVSGALQG